MHATRCLIHSYCHVRPSESRAGFGARREALRAQHTAGRSAVSQETTGATRTTRRYGPHARAPLRQPRRRRPWLRVRCAAAAAAPRAACGPNRTGAVARARTARDRAATRGAIRTRRTGASVRRAGAGRRGARAPKRLFHGCALRAQCRGARARPARAPPGPELSPGDTRRERVFSRRSKALTRPTRHCPTTDPVGFVRSAKHPLLWSPSRAWSWWAAASPAAPWRTTSS